MVLVNKAINEVTVKLVYYGPGLCGKTTNLEKIYANPKLDNKGKMISMSTETDRTLFFDFMPMELGTVGGQKVRVQLYTVPGQVFYDATRKLVLRGADGVVFVADSQASMRESNLESLENLKTNLRLNRIDPDKVAMVFQYNKRDLPAVSSVDEMNGYLNPGRAPAVEAIAIQGTGVTATLRQAVGRILENLKKRIDITLEDAPELAAPDMKAKSGATASSAGTPKLSMRSTTAPPAAPPSKTEQPFSVASIAAEIEAEEAVGSAPFASASAARSPDPLPQSPFEVDAEPFGGEAPGPGSAGLDDDLFSSGQADQRASDRVEAERMLASARRLVASLEASLDAAREHERELAAKFH